MNPGLFAEGYRTVNMLAWKKKVTEGEPEDDSNNEEIQQPETTLPVLLYPSTVNPIPKYLPKKL
jgi:hypothetical protein